MAPTKPFSENLRIKRYMDNSPLSCGLLQRFCLVVWVGLNCRKEIMCTYGLSTLPMEDLTSDNGEQLFRLFNFNLKDIY